MATRLMRAVQIAKFGGPELMQVVNIPVPKPAESQLLLKILSAGVNPVDTYVRSGNISKLPDLPFTIGKDGAGIVEEVGEGVNGFKKGDRVFCTMAITGTYAEYALSDDTHTFPLSRNLSYEMGAALGIPYFTAYRALMIKANAKAGDTVLVHGGSGAVGLAALQIARGKSMKILATAGTLPGMELVKKNGADHVFNHREKDYLQDMMDATDGRGVDVILEMLANVNLEHDLKMMAYAGRIVVIGSRGNVTIAPRLTMAKESTITGMALANTSKEEWASIGKALVAGIEEGWVNPVIKHIYPLEETEEAHHEVMLSSGHLGKLLLKP
ncbi:PREDICTED: quinone oxidoreductase-like [Priapulus caudatus]|uniref:Quinone oxidoreductase-like n=1 Tax=Priapulus caudatus TaxID=37621 RepID=A0ABM1DWK5_PRICU|nr:PREDICTED: quinone oxidoreductase-like [Priapulus caudatus]XP_014664325.1 PREDICTED: quinone oxidoreductase-like [Priapulus caudatus]XP_014664326.1 PREDICTED: quinone oxidoreductase-like [Priapulus caudatus]